MTNQPTLLEQSVESTKKLAWYDDMIRHYGAMQWHVKCLLEAMNLQTRIDGDAASTLHAAYALSLAKLAKLNEARQAHYERHERIMTAILDGEE